MVESRRRTSLLAYVALIGGLAAIGLSRFDVPGYRTVSIGAWHPPTALVVAVASLIVALLALLLASASRRTGTGLPILAALLCGVVSGLTFSSSYGSGWLARHLNSTPATPAVNSNPPTTSAQPQVAHPTAPPKPSETVSIFDDQFKGSTPPPTTSTPAGTSHSGNSARPALAAPSIPKPDPATLMRAAHSRLEAARAAVIASLAGSPDYRAAKADSDAADQDLKTARATYAPGSPELITANQNAIDAHAKLQRVISAAMEKDPGAQQAQSDLRDAEKLAQH